MYMYLLLKNHNLFENSVLSYVIDTQKYDLSTVNN